MNDLTHKCWASLHSIVTSFRDDPSSTYIALKCGRLVSCRFVRREQQLQRPCWQWPCKQQWWWWGACCIWQQQRQRQAFVSCLQKELLVRLSPPDPHAHAHGRQALQMCRVRQGIHYQGQPEGRADSILKHRETHLEGGIRLMSLFFLSLHLFNLSYTNHSINS